MGNLGDLGDRVYGSEDIADVSDADDFRLFRDQRFQ